MTKKEILKQVFAELAIVRAHAIQIANKNKKQAMQSPQFNELLQKERLLKMEIGNIRFEGGDETQKILELEQTLQQKQQILQTMGLSVLDLLPAHQCLKCSDTGVFNNEICACVLQKYNNKLMQMSNVDLSKMPNFNQYDYRFFDDKEEQQFAQKCVETLKKYVQNFENLTLKNIVMSGASGTGKTYLTKCLAKELIAKNKTTLFISSFDINNLFLEQHLSSSEQKNHMQNIIDVDALIIDDLGTEPLRKNVTKEYLLILLNERIAKNKSTIITTNLNPEQVLDKYQERIFSRIFNKRETLVLQFVGKNQRLNRK